MVSSDNMISSENHRENFDPADAIIQYTGKENSFKERKGPSKI